MNLSERAPQVVVSTEVGSPGDFPGKGGHMGSGTVGITGEISAANPLVGAQTNDVAGGLITNNIDDNLQGCVRALADGYHLVLGPSWDNRAINDAGAVSWG